MRTRAIIIAILAVSLGSGCTRGPGAPEDASIAATTIAPTPTADATALASPTPAPTPTASLDPEVAEAVDFRQTFGLRADLPYVIASLTDPAASNLDYGVPVYPDEAIRLQEDLAEQNATIPIVVEYAQAHADESGGVYIDRDQHVGMVTSLWTGHLAEHAAALAKLLDGKVTLVRQVSYTEAELRVLQEKIFADRDWMEAIPARMTSIGVGTLSNAVHMDVSSTEPTAVQQILDHYGLGDRLVVVSDGTGEVFIPQGDVKGKVRLRNGKIPSAKDSLSIEYFYDPATPGSCGSGDMGYGVRDDGTFTYPCQAGKRVLVIYGENRKELGRAAVDVIGGQTVTVTIRLTRDP